MTAGAEHRSPRRPLLLLAALAGLVLVADVVSKSVAVRALADRGPVELIPGVLDLQLTRNSGAAFSVGTGATLVFTLIAVGVVVAVVLSARRLRSHGWALVLGGLLGGALGNLTDRVFRSPGLLRGEVVDWIHLHHWPVFNLADSAIVIAGIAAVVLSGTGRRLDGGREPGRAEREREQREREEAGRGAPERQDADAPERQDADSERERQGADDEARG